MSFTAESIGEQSYAGQYTRILELSYPARVKQGDPVQIVLKAQVNRQHTLPQFMLGIQYVDGPASHIQFSQGRVARGYSLVLYSGYTVGTTATLLTSFRADIPGIYRFKAMVGFGGAGTYIDNTVEFSITVLSPSEAVAESLAVMTTTGISLTLGIVGSYVAIKVVKSMLDKLKGG